MKLSFNQLLDAARAHEIDTSAAEFGFETRLQAAMRGQDVETGFVEFFASWLWKSTFALIPVIAVLIAFAIISHGLSIPPGASGVVGHVVDFLPFHASTLSAR